VVSLFELGVTDGPAARVASRLIGDFSTFAPWETLDPDAFPDELRARARVGWTESAFNEHCTAAAMAQLVHALVAAGAPLDLIGVASTFAAEELVHVDLCARVAAQLGGGAPIAYDPAALTLEVAPGGTALQVATELVVRVCCVGEAFSLPMLAGARSAASHPVTRAVLDRIVRGEALHGQLGWWYLDWVGPTLDASERARLGAVAREQVAHLRPLWERLRGATTGARSAAEADAWAALGWMPAADYHTLAEQVIADEVLGRLGTYGIC
jgi:hypothetical protein